MPSSEVMKKFHAGTLRTSHGKLVTDINQAVAIKKSEEQNEAAHGGRYVSSGRRHNPLKGTRRPRARKEM